MKLRTPGKFGHTFANSGNPDEDQDFHCLLSWLFFIPITIIWINQGRCSNLPDVRSYLTLPYFSCHKAKSVGGEKNWQKQEACIGVLGIQDICHFTSRDIGYYRDMGYLVQYFRYFQGYWKFRKINYGDICQFIRDICLFTSRDMGYSVPPYISLKQPQPNTTRSPALIWVLSLYHLSILQSPL